jgi:hypothetical protein
MDVNDVLGNQAEQPIKLSSDVDVLVKKKVRVADMFSELAKNRMHRHAQQPIGVVRDRNLNSIFFI